jgi:hypothetical protein
MKSDKDHKVKLGLIAQEVEEVLPEVVGVDYDNFKTVSYQNIVAVLIEAVKELSEEVDTLKAQINK